MVTQKRQPGQEEIKPETQRLLTAADYFLHSRNFADCCKYAARARESDRAHPAPTQIFSVASVLSVSTISRFSPTQPDYYAVLNLPYFDNDAARIGSSFKTLASNLDPKSNRYPFSSEAFDLVLKAWSVLSNPVEKARFDNELRMSLTAGGGTFWTICPYCYCVYEYEKVFEDCCLRCANERCRRVLHAVAIGAPPPPDVVDKGQYWCPGFMPFEICNGNGERIGEKPWTPFPNSTESAGKGCNSNFPSDVDETVEGKEFQNHGNGDDKNDVTVSEKLQSGSGSTVEKSVNEVRMKRKKSVPWNSKKVMGRGIRIDSSEAHFIFGVAGGYSGKMLDDDENGVEFFEGDDDVFVGLPSDFDLENGEM